MMALAPVLLSPRPSVACLSSMPTRHPRLPLPRRTQRVCPIAIHVTVLSAPSAHGTRTLDHRGPPGSTVSVSFPAPCPAAGSLAAASLARQSTFYCIQSFGAIACLRSADEEVALHAARAALDGGVSVLEVTMTTYGAFQIIKKLVREYPSATIGAGTILTWQDAERAKEAGATFLTSPVTEKELVQAHSSSNVLFIPGVTTPSEILQARRWGASCVKLYPVSLMGGVQYVEMLKKMFPNIPIIASNGIFLDTVKNYLQVGSTAVILSDAVFNKTALSQHDYAHIFQLSKLVAALLT